MDFKDPHEIQGFPATLHQAELQFLKPNPIWHPIWSLRALRKQHFLKSLGGFQTTDQK